MRHRKLRAQFHGLLKVRAGLTPAKPPFVDGQLAVEAGIAWLQSDGLLIMVACGLQVSASRGRVPGPGRTFG